MLRLKLCHLPLLLLWLDLVYGFILNIYTSWVTVQQTLTQKGSLVAPNVTFSWLEMLTNGVMVLAISYALWTLYGFARAVGRGEFWGITLRRLFGLCLILAFSLPSWWQWAWAITDAMNVIDWNNKHYLITAILMPYPAGLCLWLLCRKRWRKPIEVEPEPVESHAPVFTQPLRTPNNSWKNWKKWY